MSSEKTAKKKNRKYTLELTPFSIIIGSLVAFFFLTWIFVLGILVGRGFFPGTITTVSELKGEVNKLQDMVKTKETAPSEQKDNKDNVEVAPELAFYDKLTTKKDDAKNTWQNEDAGTAETDKTNPPPAATVAEKKPVETVVGEKPVETVANKKTINDNTEKKTVNDDIAVSPPAKSTPGSDSGKYTVQVASSGDLDKALKMVKQITEKGFDAYYYETKVNGKTYYRVRSGKFSDKAEALNYSKKLEEKTGLKGFVTVNE